MGYDLNNQNSYEHLKGYPMDVKSHAACNIAHPHGNDGNGMKQFTTGEFTKPTFQCD